MSKLLDSVCKSQDLSGLSVDEMYQLASELRKYIIEVVSKNGGHLAPSLGVVELTIALHKALDLPNDQIVWDVGHQCYAHKILSGRLEEFKTLRQFKGLSGFPKPYESEYDSFVAGHSSTSVSVAVGLAQAAKINNEKKRVVAVIGDGALTGGMVYEALNHGGDLRTPFTVILNDNEMSIAANVGSMSKYLTKMRSNKRYQKLKQKITHELLKNKRYGKEIYYHLEHFRNSMKYFLVQGVFFEEMGFVYLGPVDGHNIPELLDVLRRAADINKPTLIHIITRKGKGFQPAEENPTAFHGTKPFDVLTGAVKPSKEKAFTAYFSDAILKLAAENKKIVGITAAMPDGTGMKKFAEAYPERFYDVGIAEAHAVTFAGALASRGVKPIVAIYSTFLQRGFDQVFHDICLANVPVVLAVDRAGIVGDDGETHQGMFDMAILRTLPNLNIMAPRDGQELLSMMDFAVSLDKPVAVRYPRGGAPVLEFDHTPLEYGKGQVLIEGDSGAVGLLAVGSMVSKALQIAEKLNNDIKKIAVADLRFVKPLDESLIVEFAKKYNKLAVLEDGVLTGGVGCAVLEVLRRHNLQPQVELFAFPDEFIPQGKPKELFDHYGMSADKIAEKIVGRWF
ncbi:MAG: 1-deoxy-D-xylulose-5-phosphate synthase [Bacillota bacterium]|jgi:1-deoxy-D-xylulose-5-phosphate synthase